MAPITDADWAEIAATELPKASDPVVQKYLASRHALMTEEQKHRSGSVVIISAYESIRLLTKETRLLLPPGPLTNREESM